MTIHSHHSPGVRVCSAFWRSTRSLGVMILFIGVLTGCESPTVESVTDDYLERLERVLEQPRNTTLAQSGKTLPVDYPPLRKIKLHPKEMNADWSDFFSLGLCGDLKLHIAERNTALGRMLQPEERLWYEHRLLALLAQCRNKVASPRVQLEQQEATELRQLLNAIEQQKRQQIDQHFWNALFANSDYIDFFSPTTHSAERNLEAGEPVESEALRTLAQFKASLGTDKAPPKAKINRAFQLLESSRTLGQLLKSLAELTSALTLASDILEQRLDNNPVCFQGKPNETSKILLNVFKKSYGIELQTLMADVEKRLKLLVTEVNALIPEQTAPDAFNDYQQTYLKPTTSSFWEGYYASVERHTHAWQRLLEQCGSVPGSDNYSAD